MEVEWKLLVLAISLTGIQVTSHFWAQEDYTSQTSYLQTRSHDQFWPMAYKLKLCESLHVMVGEGNGNPFLYSCLENSMDRGAWQATVHGATQSRTQLSNSLITQVKVINSTQASFQHLIFLTWQRMISYLESHCQF